MMPKASKDGTLPLPCGALFTADEYEDWRIYHFPYCGICEGNYWEPRHA